MRCRASRNCFILWLPDIDFSMTFSHDNLPRRAFHQKWRQLSARAWILAMLPYILWGIVGSATHFHRADGQEISCWNASAIEEINAQSSTRSQQRMLAPDVHTHLASEKAACLLCHWNNHASLSVAATRLRSILEERRAAFTPISPLHIARVIHNAANRGPPLS